MYITREDILSATAVQIINASPDLTGLDAKLRSLYQYLHAPEKKFDASGIMELTNSTELFDLLKGHVPTQSFSIPIFENLWYNLSKIKLEQDAIRGLCFLPKRNFTYDDLVSTSKKLFPDIDNKNEAIKKMLELFYTEESVKKVFTDRLK